MYVTIIKFSSIQTGHMPWFCDLGTHVGYLFHGCSEELSTVLGIEHSSQQSFSRLSNATNQGLKGTEIISPRLSLQIAKNFAERL